MTIVVPASLSYLPDFQTYRQNHNDVFSCQRTSGHFCKEIDPENSPNPGPQGKFQNLGHKFVDGIKIRGERTSFYASVEAKLSGAAPIQITEDWCSKVLDTPVVNYVLPDQPKLEMRAVVSEVRQMEPDPELFEIPEGYKIIKDDRTPQKPNKQLGSSRPTAPTV